MERACGRRWRMRWRRMVPCSRWTWRATRARPPSNRYACSTLLL
jgi:hypothetical protein